MSVRPSSATDIDAMRALVADVRDPEIPLLTIDDLGVLRNVMLEDDRVRVVITPTYSGCPAMDTIASDIKGVLDAAGHHDVEVELQLAPAWTTDWLSAAGREKLLAEGIAPPVGRSAAKASLLGSSPTVACPQCGAKNTECISEFGSTACKALYRCLECLEPFDYFKCL